ncbi:MAG: trypsin-like peptidase domain-containing protein [Candidatus Aenigmarchaeota archaeon]|nr:trypsin-like peptidase domain-containing protein [Candidatus Aenigmarchaeota archaeon]
MKRKTRQRLDFIITGTVGVLIGALLVLSLLTLFENLGIDYGLLKMKTVYINGTETFEGTTFRVLEQNRESVVYINSERDVRTIYGTVVSTSSGSGFVLSDDGYIATNNHVISDAETITVTLFDGSSHSAQLVGTDSFNDIAVIKINATGLDPVELGDSDEVRQGELVFALGSPFTLQNTITSGIASGTKRKIELENGFEIDNVIQTDAAINPGNSGGPLLNSRGQVIGINTAIISKSGGSEGVGFAVPINTVKKITDEIIGTGGIARPWFGIIGIEISESVSAFWNLSVNSGVLILDLDDYGNAKEAGLRKTVSTPEKDDFVMGDIITALDGKKVGDMDEFVNRLMKYQPGDTVEVEYYRGGEKFETTVLLKEKQ